MKQLLLILAALLLPGTTALGATTGEWLLFGSATRNTTALKAGEWANWDPAANSDDSPILGVGACENVDFYNYADKDGDNTKGTTVDPVPASGGMINETTVVGFDSQNRVIVSYHKFDAGGHTQAYNARWEQDRWKLYQTSDWGYRWYFSGGGCIVNEVDVGPITPAADGSLIQPYYHVNHGQGIWKLDEETLKPIASLKAGPGLLGDVARVKSRFPSRENPAGVDASAL